MMSKDTTRPKGPILLSLFHAQATTFTADSPFRFFFLNLSHCDSRFLDTLTAFTLNFDNHDDCTTHSFRALVMHFDDLTTQESLN